MLQGIPEEWFKSSSNFYIKNAPVSDGNINLIVSNNYEFKGKVSTERKWVLNLPFDFLEIKQGSEYVRNSITANGKTLIELAPGSIILKFVFQDKEHTVPNS